MESDTELQLRRMEKWFSRLFRLDMTYTALAILSLSFLDDAIPFIKWIMYPAAYGVLLAVGVAYLKMASMDPKHYRLAGIAAMALSVVYAVNAFFLTGALTQGLWIVKVVVTVTLELAYMFGLCSGNALALEQIDDGISRDWRRLLAWFLVVDVLCIIIACLVMNLPGLVVYIDIITTVPSRGLDILRVAYLYKSGKACWEYRTYE